MFFNKLDKRLPEVAPLDAGQPEQSTDYQRQTNNADNIHEYSVGRTKKIVRYKMQADNIHRERNSKMCSKICVIQRICETKDKRIQM